MAMSHSHVPSRQFPERPKWTVADLAELPDDGNRYEILHGELLVTPLPSFGHQGVAGRLATLFATWCRAHTGWAVRAPGGLYLNETLWFEPDVAVYPVPEFGQRNWRDLPPALLVVEVLSPSTRNRDRNDKRPEYVANGVREVWLVDEGARSIGCPTRTCSAPALRRQGPTHQIPTDPHPHDPPRADYAATLPLRRNSHHTAVPATRAHAYP